MAPSIFGKSPLQGKESAKLTRSFVQAYPYPPMIGGSCLPEFLSQTAWCTINLDYLFKKLKVLFVSYWATIM